jgi:hypothetical protein
VVNLSGKKHEPVNGGYTSVASGDLARLADDTVSDVVFGYGKLDSKIATMAQLRVLDGARPELALLSLGRAYASWCVGNGGKWTSGLHMLWWTRKRLTATPDVKATELRLASPLPPIRQLELAQWSLVMMRLVFISDVASYARESSDRVGKLAGLAEKAAEETGQLRPARLLRWIERNAAPAFDAVLPHRRYEKLAEEVRAEAAQG